MLIAVSLLAFMVSIAAYCPDDMTIWKEFVTLLKKGDITQDKIRPYDELFREPLLEFLQIIKEHAIWEDFEAEPEIHRVSNQVHYLIPLTLNGQKGTYCFTLLVKGEEWYFQHIEAITIRLDKISSFPTSTFPDLPEKQKAYIREEIRASERVRLFNLLVREKGKDFAFNWFRDGAGYFLAAKVWVPFVPPSKAFILYLCWEQANLRGNNVILEKLDDNEAIVRMKLKYLELYKEAAHLKQQISFEDYRQIFETIWQDRASKAGWNLQIAYEQGECLFHFKRGS